MAANALTSIQDVKVNHHVRRVLFILISFLFLSSWWLKKYFYLLSWNNKQEGKYTSNPNMFKDANEFYFSSAAWQIILLLLYEVLKCSLEAIRALSKLLCFFRVWEENLVAARGDCGVLFML